MITFAFLAIATLLGTAAYKLEKIRPSDSVLLYWLALILALLGVVS